VTKDDDVRFGVELRQAAGNAPIELTIIHQPQPLGDYIQTLEAEAKQTGPVPVGEHDAPSSQPQCDHDRQCRAAVGEVLEVDVATHSVHRRDCPQRFQCCWVIHVASVQNQVHPGQRVEHRIGQPLQAMGDVGVGE